MIKHVQLVCTGNICRSPMAEAMLRTMAAPRLPGIDFASCGTHALVGHAADENAQAAMQTIGIDMRDFTARQARPEIVLQSDIVLVMEDEHRQWLHKTMPQARGRIYLFGKWAGDEAIPDPYGRPQEYFAHVRDMIEQHARKWIDWMAVAVGNK